jgi:hypothetical protein
MKELFEGKATVEFSLPIEEILPSREQVIQNMGYLENNIDGYFIELLEAELDQARSLIVSKGIYAEYGIKAISRDDGYFSAGGREFTPGPRILARLTTAQSIAVFACTLGAEIGKRIRYLVREGSSVEAYMLDSIAGLAADNVAEAVQQRAEIASAAKGYGCTERFSPGYCGWPVSAQETLFSLLPPETCGISLNASSMMVPEKSVSGVFGIGPGMRRLAYGCGGCEIEDCPMRRRMT